MRIQDLNSKKICLVGYGREGQEMQKALAIYAPQATITVADADETVQAPGAQLQLGKDYLKGLNNFDVVIRSSGVAPHTPELEAANVTDMTRIFFDTIATSGVRTIGVTGSKGKSTTSNLIYAALKAHNPRTFLMGNIGLPMIMFIGEARADTTFVIELSSYMLEDLSRSPNIAVVTSFFPEHLDRHGSVFAYWEAKTNIASHQNPSDTVFYNSLYDECLHIAQASPGKKVPFTAADFPLNVTDTQLIGEHNRSNLAAAFKVATYLGVPEEAALQALKTAQPLPHRLQKLGTHREIAWVNDSFATAPDATIAALDALSDDVETIIIGGFDRGVEFDALADRLVKSAVKNIVAFPPTGSKIYELMKAQGATKTYVETTSMPEAVTWAAAHTSPGKTCLLSPASPSFGTFKNFVERGEAFIAAVEKL